MAENKVQFGLDSLYYAVITETNGVISYGTPVRIPGAVSLSMDAQNGETTFYADNVKYYVSTSNNGYTGDIEVARIPDAMWSDVFGATLDQTDKVLVENVDDAIKEVALLFRFAGDKNKNCCALYRCTLGRPSRSHSTTNETTDPQTETISYTAVPLSDGRLRATTTSETPAATKEAWFDDVFGA